MKECSQVYERIATGELPSRIVYKNVKHGVMALLEPSPVAEGHLTIATIACAPSVDAIKSPVLYGKLMTTAQYAGRVLAEAYPEAPYVGGMIAGNQIRHPHLHRVPGDPEADWLKRFAKLPEWPRLKLSDDQMDDVYGRLTEPETVRELWEACDGAVKLLGNPDEATFQAVRQLDIPLPWVI